jgi:hypothetical protein
MNDEHRHDHVRPPRALREQLPIALLWRVRKSRALRMAALYAHDLGFELRIVDQRGDFVFTQVHGSEPACVLDAAAREGVYLSKGGRGSRTTRRRFDSQPAVR